MTVNKVTVTDGRASGPYDQERAEKAVRELLLALGEDPDREGDVAGSAGDAADGEQDKRRHAAGNPEGASPIDCPVKLAGGIRRPQVGE
mgnify:CR=1 FL=1